MLSVLMLLAHTSARGQSAVDSPSIKAIFAAAGGSVTTSGAFTAGASPGTFRIVATSGGLADTATVTVMAAPAAPSPPAAPSLQAAEGRTAEGKPGTGIPFGPFGGWAGSTPKPNTGVFTLAMGGVKAAVIIDRLSAARSRGLRLITNMTGGGHGNYMTDGVFDVTKWEAAMNTYNTPAIKAAVADAVADGTLIGNILMDEPANTSAENSWGPAGTMSKERVDAMAVFAKTIFPTLPMGVTLDYRIWNDRSFRVVDFQVSQYRHAKGKVTAYRDGALALGARDGQAILFSMNILDGGKRAADCPVPETGGAGTYGRNCRMSPEQVLEYGKILGPAGCAFLMWRYDPAFMAQSENQQAFNELAGRLATGSATSCKRA
jgi:hypothetical protein